VLDVVIAKMVVELKWLNRKDRETSKRAPAKKAKTGQ